MNIDDYVNHIRKKYRLAFAVTIIQNKPEHVTTNKYIEKLRKNIENASNTDFDEISINSNDFLYEDDAEIPINKELNTHIEQNEETTHYIKKNNTQIHINNIFHQDISREDGETNCFATAEFKEAQTYITGQGINDNPDIIHGKYINKVQPNNMRDKHTINMNATNDLIETCHIIKSPNILENFNLKPASMNKTSAINEKDLQSNEMTYKETNIVETHENMNSPNILEHFDIEQAIQAHSSDRNKTGVDEDVFEEKNDDLDSVLQKQSHKNDNTKSKTRNISSTITIKNKEQSKPNLIVEDSQLIDNSDTDSNITVCDVTENSMDDITDVSNNNHVKFDTQTTFCDQNTQIEIDLININEGSNKDVYNRHEGKNNNIAKDLQVTYYHLTECNTVNLKEKLHPNQKTKEELKIKKGDLIEATISNKKSEEHNKLKRKHNEGSESITDIDMLSQINRVDINEIDSQATELYTVDGFSKPLSHISQSQAINTYNIDQKHVQKAKQQKNLTKDILEEEFYIELSPDIDKTKVQKNKTKNIVYTDFYPQLSPNIEFQDNTHDFDYNNLNMITNGLNSESTSNDYDSINLYHDDSYKENSKGLKNNTFETQTCFKDESLLLNKRKDVTESKSNRNNNDTNIANDNYVSDKNYLYRVKESIVNTEEQGPEKQFKHHNINTNAGLNMDTNEIPVNVQEVTEKDVEIIPFKVIEEMNRVKVYLSRDNNRRISTDGFSADSGFLSDTQIKNSLQLSSQCSENWLNQSAYSILVYLLKCPLLTTNMDFVEEISMVLCELIDKLHAEENYPPFLDLILEKIESFLEEICSGNDDELETKTERIIHRFLLLNKSINIIKYTLEKLTKILEKIHENFTKTACYEITNINETQSSTYIFHVLEIIIKRYLKQKEDLCTQNTQTNEVLTKKTCITDIWRAKWNSKFKSFKELPSRQVQEDVTDRMAVILNKIIINCMDGYSLVAFAALQCFNVLQS